MYDTVLKLGILWMSGVLAVVAVLAIRGRSSLERILAMDTIAFILVGLLALVGYSRDSIRYLDSALVLALLGFIGTLAVVRYLGEGRIL